MTCGIKIVIPCLYSGMSIYTPLPKALLFGRIFPHHWISGPIVSRDIVQPPSIFGFHPLMSWPIYEPSSGFFPPPSAGPKGSLLWPYMCTEEEAQAPRWWMICGSGLLAVQPACALCSCLCSVPHVHFHLIAGPVQPVTWWCWHPQFIGAVLTWCPMVLHSISTRAQKHARNHFLKGV